MTKEETDKMTVIDGGGRTLIPGLIDCHVHCSIYRPPLQMRANMSVMEVAAVSAARMENWLLTGFTTLRDIGGASSYLQRAIDKYGVLKGPRIFSSEALVSQTCGHGDFRALADRHPNMYNGAYHWWEQELSFLADGPTEIRRAIRENFRRGATQIKVLTTGGVSSETDPIHAVQYTAEEIQTAVKTAEQWKTYVASHSIAPDGAMLALENGVMSIEHGAGLNEEALLLLKEKGAWLVTDLWVLMGMDEEQGKKQLSANSFKKWKQVKDGMHMTMELAVKHDVQMAFGTDILPVPEQALESDAMSLIEFEYLAKYMEPWKALRMATGNAGKLVSLCGPNTPYPDGTLGTLEVGSYADMILVNGDPTEDIKWILNRDNFAVIMKDGVIYKNALGEREDGTPSVVEVDRGSLAEAAFEVARRREHGPG